MPLAPDTLETPTADPTELPEGTRLLDRYTIIDRIGSGGMASIYRAMDERLDRVVCVKLLRLVLEGSGSGAGGNIYQATYSHFLQEALALSKLQHPNTLKIYDFGYLDDATARSAAWPEDAAGRPFQISEYLDGGSLESRVKRGGKLAHFEIEHVLERIASAVTEAHEKRIIHRDIKPSNILFARIGGQLVPKLADFGIARSELKKQRRAGAPAPNDDGEASSPSTVVLFSPRWAAPEQLCGAPEGPYTDVYALGLITMYMLTGRTPFDEHDVRGTFNSRVRSDEILTARLRERGVAGAMYDVLMRAMAADPKARIDNAPELFARVKEALGHADARATSELPPPARVQSPPQDVPRPAPPPPPLPEPSLVDLESVSIANGRQEIAPPSERARQAGRYRVRVVEVNESIDFTRAPPRGNDASPETRFRITMLPAHNGPLRINVKGLSCFVAWADGAGRPTPAIVATQDGAVDLVSSTRERMGRISWTFGTPTHRGHLFLVDGQELVIPYAEATHAVVVHLGDDRELVAMCKRV